MKPQALVFLTFLPLSAWAGSGTASPFCTVPPGSIASTAALPINMATPSVAPILPPSNASTAVSVPTAKPHPSPAAHPAIASDRSGGGEGAVKLPAGSTTSGAVRIVPVSGRMPLTPVSAAKIASEPALKLLASHGAQLYVMPLSHGLQGIFARNGKHFAVFYVTPDGKAAIQGQMWSDDGMNLTLRQVSGIPGVLPTVTVGNPPPEAKVTQHLIVPFARPSTSGTTTVVTATPNGQAPAPERQPSTSGSPDPATARSKPTSAMVKQTADLTRMLKQSSHGTIGAAKAPRVWMLVDPLCMYSIDTMHALMPYITAGKLRVSVVPLSVLDYEDHGASTSKAEIMVSRPKATMVADWIGKGLPEAAKPHAAAKLASNMTIAVAIRLTGTPTILWRLPDGRFARINGVPSNVPAMINAAAGRS